MVAESDTITVHSAMATPSMTHPLAVSVRESNRQGRGAWERFEPHRRRVMGILDASATATRSLAILGPGNLNDVDLPALAAAYGRVHLVDLDREAVERALERHTVASTGVQVHAPVHLTGVLPLLGTERPEPTRVLTAARTRRALLSGAPFDVTALTGVLTQLLQSVVELGLPRAEVPRVALAVRDAHMRHLVGLTCPGGAVVLITDVVSSSTAPGLLRTPSELLEPAMAVLVANGNFFTGTNPYRIVALFEEDEELRAAVERVELLGPWLWRRHLTGST